MRPHSTLTGEMCSILSANRPISDPSMESIVEEVMSGVGMQCLCRLQDSGFANNWPGMIFARVVSLCFSSFSMDSDAARLSVENTFFPS